jgi:hypothetical protein
MMPTLLVGYEIVTPVPERTAVSEGDAFSPSSTPLKLRSMLLRPLLTEYWRNAHDAKSFD